MPNTQDQVRAALRRVTEIDLFVRKYSHLGVTRRTVFRQRGEAPPPMRPYTLELFKKALLDEGLLDDPKAKAKVSGK